MNREILKKSYELVFLMFICITILLYFRSTNYGLEDKHVISLQLSGLVTSIAAFHYYYMMTTKDSPVSYRYFDWFFTTPILLIDLCILLDIFESEFVYKIVGLNTLMLAIGYLGEMNILSMMNSTILGFIPFAIIFYMIYAKMNEKHKEPNVTDAQVKSNENLFNVFVTLWSFYGLTHLVPNMDTKNILYNGLDLITKGFFGLYVYTGTPR